MRTMSVFGGLLTLLLIEKPPTVAGPILRNPVDTSLKQLLLWSTAARWLEVDKAACLRTFGASTFFA